MDLPDDYVRLRYVQSPTPQDIRLFLAYFSSQLNDEEYKVKFIETMNEKSLLIDLGSSELCGKNIKPEDMCYQQKIVILDKENREAVIYDSDFFKMKFQRVNEHLMRLEEAQEQQQETKRAKLKANLSANFGSKISQRLVQERIKNQDNRAGIDSTIEFVGNDEKLMEDLKTFVEPQEEAMSSYFPPHNLAAVSPKDAFPLDGIITSDEISSLENASKDFIESNLAKINEWEKEKTYGHYVCMKLKRLPADDKARRHFACLLKYFHYMITLYNCKAPQLKKRDFLPRETPSTIKVKLTESFTLPITGQKTGRSMPHKMKDNLMFHIIVLSLHIDEFHVQVSDLNEDLKGKDLVKYFRMIGCQVRKILEDNHIKNNAIATLKVPLKFPEIENKGHKRKRH